MIGKRKVVKVFALSATAVFLSGCAATYEANDKIKENRKQTIREYEKAKPVTSAGLADPSRGEKANFAKLDRNWVNPEPIRRDINERRKDNLPAIFKKEVSLTMPGRVTLVEVLSEIQRSSGILVDLNNDIYNNSGDLGNVIGATSSNTGGEEPIVISDFVFRGVLDDALDLLASKANVSWRWTGSSIELFKYEVKSYNVSLLAGITTSSSEVNLSGESGSEAGDSSVGSASNDSAGSAGVASSSGRQGVQRSATLDSWVDVRNYLISLMSSKGSIAVMESTGLVTIKDTPQVHRKVAQAIDDLNKLIGTQIYINVDVYAVTVNADDDYGLDWNLAWSSVRNQIGYVTGPSSSASNTFTTGILTGPFTGTEAVIKALSTIGKTSVVNQFQITTLNGQPTPIGNNRKIPYISGIDIQSDTNGNPMQSITTSAIYQGISMSVIPKVQPNGKILLEYAMNLSDFEGFTQFSTGTGENSTNLSLPTTTLKNILQRASLKSGQALILSGFKQSVADTSKQGVGSPSNFLFGGGSKAGTREQYLVITVTPYVAQD